MVDILYALFMCFTIVLEIFAIIGVLIIIGIAVVGCIADKKIRKEWKERKNDCLYRRKDDDAV